MSENLTYKIGWSLFKSKWGEMEKPAKRFVSWPDVNSILLLADITLTEDLYALEDFVKMAEGDGKNVLLLGYYHSSEPLPALRTKVLLFNKKQVNFFNVPSDTVMSNIKGRTFDLMIDCNFTTASPLCFLSKAVKATCKVGHTTANHYDMSVCIQAGIDEYLKQVRNYLSIISTGTR